MGSLSHFTSIIALIQYQGNQAFSNITHFMVTIDLYIIPLKVEFFSADVFVQNGALTSKVYRDGVN